MSKGQVEYRTPVCIMKGLEKQFQKIERGSWQHKPIPLEPQMTFFNNKPTYKWSSEYDHFFAYTKIFPLWDRRKAKCNGVYLPDIHENTFQQEKEKPVPVLTSMVYGRPCRPFYDLQENYRRQHATSDFYRPRGVMRVIEKELQ
ncbi:uncharacterized protein LOC123307856 [Coccinella septempunctata]|uniref:uncharacterized protein LOC123307856 n=1 Tax=Coccinella septempunctata TaxID=41139 RepID=UPI001D086EBB|nr:uncharacterized protein LOC123307856 [Coccinella septempunctata]